MEMATAWVTRPCRPAVDFLHSYLLGEQAFVQAFEGDGLTSADADVVLNHRVGEGRAVK